MRSRNGFAWSPFGGGTSSDDLESLLEKAITPSPPTKTSFVLPLLLDDDDEPEEESTTKRTLNEKDLPPSVKEKLERKRRK